MESLATAMREKTQILESDLIYPHGKIRPKTQKGIDGYLLALQYKNAASLGRALSALGGIVYWLPRENDRAVIWLSLNAAQKLPHKFSDRLSYLAQFEVDETKRPRGSPKTGHVSSPQNRPYRRVARDVDDACRASSLQRHEQRIERR